MATFQEHIAYLAKNGLARTNRFQVIIPLPQKLLDKTSNTKQDKTSSFFGSDVIQTISSFVGGGTAEISRGLDIMVESTDIPGKNLVTTEIKYNGDYYKLPYGVVYEAQSFTFNVSRNMYEKNIIDEWMNIIFDPIKHTIGYMDDYATTITINQMDEQDNIVYSIQLKDAFPTMCNPVTVSNEERDSFVKLTTNFMFKRWERVGEQGSDDPGVSSLTQTPLGPIVTPILSNPAVQGALTSLEDQTGLDLDGEAANIYNQVDNIVKGSTGTDSNKIASYVEQMKAQVSINGNITETQKGQLVNKFNDVVSKLRG
jgi:hypothetical protein